MKRILFILTGLLLWLSSCKSYQKTAYDHTRKMRVKKLLREIEKHRFSAKTFESRIGVSYSDLNQSFSGNGKIRILKDSIIWGSMNFLGIPMLKFYITPDKIQYYNKIDQTYYDGNFDLLQKEFGLSFNFNNLQNLLTGDLITDLSPAHTQLKTTAKSYWLVPNDSLIKNIEISPFFKILSGYFQAPNANIQLKYKDYQKIDKQNLPKNLEIKSGAKLIQLHYKNIILDKKLRFPFKLPVDYQMIKLP